MRLFINQTNLLYTEPVLDTLTGEPVLGLIINVKVFDENNTLITGSDITLTDNGDGTYKGTEPILGLTNHALYQIEVNVLFGSTPVWYFKGPVRALIRSKLNV